MKSKKRLALCLLVALAAAVTPTATADGNVQIEWARQFGTSGFDVARANAVHGGAVYVFGAVAGALPGQTYAGGGSDVFLRKYDLAGNEIWTRQFGTTGFEEVAGSSPASSITKYLQAGMICCSVRGQTRPVVNFWATHLEFEKGSPHACRRLAVVVVDRCLGSGRQRSSRRDDCRGSLAVKSTIARSATPMLTRRA
jgi:hypothetical protein